jgi:hypothetical protein
MNDISGNEKRVPGHKLNALNNIDKFFEQTKKKKLRKTFRNVESNQNKMNILNYRGYENND